MVIAIIAILCIAVVALGAYLVAYFTYCKRIREKRAALLEGVEQNDDAISVSTD